MASNKISDILVQFVTAPPDCRFERDLNIILPIIMMKAPCLKGLRTDIVVRLLQRASHRICHDDEIVVKQGEIGQDFFIIIRGSTSVYIDPKLENDNEDLPFQEEKSARSKKDKVEVKKSGPKKEQNLRYIGEDKQKEKKDEDELNEVENVEEETKDEDGDKDNLAIGKKDKKDYLYRKKFGNLVNTLGRYESFGELALLYPSNRRMASVIADDDTDLLVVTHDLFNTTLRKIEFQPQNRLDFWFQSLERGTICVLILTKIRPNWSKGRPTASVFDPMIGKRDFFAVCRKPHLNIVVVGYLVLAIVI
ncbi:hypothetical protein CHS0354_027212 [Potamilus streckersoni]|uniref:Cyclic nucleotide-binding domain-containing protein n=1 Tax=Potamilus streckersoni TaxID=2493646 RepID=A0AAE0SZH0_9BIVA|nr:hypothetical protein CHS0354_027212 [Potamilus streckersoni]